MKENEVDYTQLNDPYDPVYDGEEKWMGEADLSVMRDVWWMNPGYEDLIVSTFLV